MLLLATATLAWAAQAPAVHAPRTRRAPTRPPPVLIARTPVLQGSARLADFPDELDFGSAGNSAMSGGGGQTTNVGGGDIEASLRLSEVQITIAGLGNERFLFQGASGAGPRPVLVLFHRFGTSHYDALVSTTFFAEAWRRRWYCVAPLGGNQTHFSSLPSQQRLDAVLQWVEINHSVDPQRFYGVGFSMGANAALNYAARHLDPEAPMFAALVNIAGGVSHEDTYTSETSVQPRFDFLFGASTTTAQPFPMQRSSMFSFDPSTFATLPDSDLARNLLHAASASFRATGDVPYLITQNDLLHQHVLALGADPLRHTLTVVPTAPLTHTWDIADERAVCDWLKTKLLVMPSSGSTLADRDARYFYFDVEQQVAGTFTPFTWSVQPAPNVLTIAQSANLVRLRVHTIDAGIDRMRQFEVQLSTADGFEDEIVMLDWPVRPTDVLRDGVTTPDWVHDANTGELTLLESDGGLHVWTVVP